MYLSQMTEKHFILALLSFVSNTLKVPFIIVSSNCKLVKKMYHFFKEENVLNPEQFFHLKDDKENFIHCQHSPNYYTEKYHIN